MEQLLQHLVAIVVAFADWWAQGFHDIQAMTWNRFLGAFWWLIIFDFPRYVLPDIVMVFYILSRLLFRWPRKVTMDRSFEPSVSVLVPAHNEEASVAKTVRSLLEQDYPIAEIIVVDDGSQDGTWQSLQAFSSDVRVRLVRNQTRGGKASALQTALRLASGEIVVSVDSDSTFDRDAIRWLVQYLRDPEVGGVSGNIKVRNRKSSLATWLQASEYAIAIATGRRVSSYVGWLTVISGAFGAYRRSDLESVGAWDPGIGDDSNITIKVRKRRRKVVFAPEAVCLTDVPERWTVLWRQRRRWDKSGYRNRLRKHVGILNPFVYGARNSTAVAISVFYKMVLLFAFLFWFFYDLLFQERGQIAWVFILTFVIYGIANTLSLLIACALSERHDEWQLLWTAPLMIFYYFWLRFPRAISTVEEIFGFNYEQRFYPDEVWAQAPKW
ncbi:MAG: glycosyltransferase family 2 protein [Coriobacteriales bacterium]|nr:glycosyltransferase [Actinomycetes bacterium]